MKKSIKVINLIVSMVLILAMLISNVFATVGTLSGESDRTTTEIKLSNGTSTGVKYTTMNLSGTYGTKIANFAEANLSNTHLTVETINCGTYLTSRTTVKSAIEKYNSTHSGETVLAAINGDLWMTNVNSNSKVTTSTLCVSRGVTIIDGEVWATQEFGMENYVNTSNAGTTATDKSAFGITADNQPLVGVPKITTTITNETRGTKIVADGINRLPAWDSLVVYNNRVYSNYALSDAYEILLETTSCAFTLKNTVSATVKAIYPADSADKPGLSSTSIVLTARGSRISDISGFKVGDKISFNLDIRDLLGNTIMWKNVVDAIGGHMQVLGGAGTYVNTSTSEYPTSLIGIKDDGTVMLCNVCATADGSYKGLKFNKALQFCQEAGYSSVFYLDGGGSSTFVTLSEGSYVVRSKSSDGSVRSVINAVAIVWHDTPVCEKQGSMYHVKSNEILSQQTVKYIGASELAWVTSNPNNVTLDYNFENKIFESALTKDFNDAGFYINFSNLAPAYAEDNRYLVLKVKTNATYTVTSEIFVCCGSTVGATGGLSTTFTVSPGDSWNYITIDMSQVSGWSGKMNSIRLDTFSGQTSKGITFYIDYIAFCNTLAEARSIRLGNLPNGAIKYFSEYINCGGNHTYLSGAIAIDEKTHSGTCLECGFASAEAHKFVSTSTIPATCKSEGKTAGISCSVCNYVLQESETIPKTNHIFVNGICFVCGEIEVKEEPDVPEEPEEPEILYGDTNGDGKINAQDANYLAQIIVGNAPSVEAADVSSDGKVNATDSNLLKQIITGTYIKS